MAEEFIIKLFNQDVEDGIKGSTSSGALAGIGKLTAIASVISGGVGIITSLVGDTVNTLLRPIIGILKGMVRLVGELLRPIVDVFVILLRPILDMLRPIIQIFRAMMGPFLRIGQEFGRLSQQALAMGENTQAMNFAIEGAKAIIGPFIVVLSSFVIEMASFLLIENVRLLLTTLVDVIRVMFQPLMDMFGIGDKFFEAMELAKTKVNEGTEFLRDSIHGLVVDGTQSMLNTIKDGADDNLEIAKNTMDDIVEVYDKAHTKMLDSVNLFVDNSKEKMLELINLVMDPNPTKGVGDFLRLLNSGDDTILLI